MGSGVGGASACSAVSGRNRIVGVVGWCSGGRAQGAGRGCRGIAVSVWRIGGACSRLGIGRGGAIAVGRFEGCVAGCDVIILLV